METIKTIHVFFAILTALSFSLRGFLRLKHPNVLARSKLMKITPHIVDTFLLISGVWLASYWGNIWLQPWFTMKMFALCAYIGVGYIALNQKFSAKICSLAWLSALLILLYIFFLATRKTVW